VADQEPRLSPAARTGQRYCYRCDPRAVNAPLIRRFAPPSPRCTGRRERDVAVTGRLRPEYTAAMRIRPLLLHALLSLALVANGIGGAMASVHAACAHDTVATAAPVAEPPCHEGMGADASNMHNGMQDDGMQHDNAPQSSVSQQPSASDKESCGDCADHCQCACTAHGLAALMPSTVLLSAATGIAYTPAPSYAHTAPALPHPVRPPIG
jgi:hypothetical protein